MFGRTSRPAAPEDLLVHLGAIPWNQVGIPGNRECFVYGLYDPAGVCFYVGQSSSLLTRAGVWKTKYGDRFADARVLRRKDAFDMDVTENFLVYQMQPEMNVIGTEMQQRRRAAKARKAPAPYNPGVHHLRRQEQQEAVS